MGEYVKDFDSWNQIKKQININPREVALRAGDVRWASLGVNVGSEIDGKGHDFSRPVLIVSVKGNTKALVVPLTSTRYKFPGYLDFDFGGRHGSLCIHDLRTISQNRIGDRYGHIHEGKQKVIKEYIKKFFQLE